MSDDTIKHKADEVLDRLATVNRELLEIRMWALALSAKKEETKSNG